MGHLHPLVVVLAVAASLTTPALGQGYGNVPQSNTHSKRTTTTFAPDVIPSDQQAQNFYDQHREPQQPDKPYSNNPFIGQKPSGYPQQPDKPFIDQKPSGYPQQPTDKPYSNNPFLNNEKPNQQPQENTVHPYPPTDSGPNQAPGSLWWVKESPFAGASPVNPPSPPSGCVGNQCGLPQKPQGSCGYSGCGGNTQEQRCDAPGHACVPRVHCRSGVVDDVSQAISGVQQCNTASQVCCRLPTTGPVPNGRPPVRDTRYPPYQGQESGPGSNGIPIGGSIYDTQPTPGPFKPYTGPLNTTPYPGCAAALKCVEEIFCTAEGVMVEKPVYLTREQAENRVPLSECSNPETGILGKCCRDPNYKDPWPGGMMMPGGNNQFDQAGFPTGQYVDHQPQPFPKNPPPQQYQPKPPRENPPYQPPQNIPRPVEPYQPPQQPYQPPQNIPRPAKPYQPPQQPYQPPQQPYQPPQQPYQPPQNIPKPVEPYQPPQQPYQPPQQPYEPPQNIPKPVEPYQPPQQLYQPPQKPYKPPQNIPKPVEPYQPPQQPYQPPQKPYKPPQNIPKPVEPYQPPQQPYQPPQAIPKREQPPRNAPDEADIVPGARCGVKRPADRSGLREGEAGRGEYPWHVLLINKATGQPLCSGALITDKAVVTAAHCVQDLDSADLQVQTGVWRLDPRAPQATSCAALARHPGHDEGTLANDMAVLLLANAVAIDQHVDTLCLPRGLPSTRGCVATGYGKQALQANVPGSTLHGLNVNFIPNNVCEQKLKSTNLGKYFVLNQSFQCAVPSNPGLDLCKVGPGGPVACDRGDGQHELSALYSWDVGCADRAAPTAFSSVDVSWIQNVLNSPLEDVVKVELNEIERKKKSQENVDSESKPGFSQGYGK